jgi:hypothetical protein
LTSQPLTFGKSIIGILTSASDKAEDVEKVFDRLRTSMLKSNAEHESAQEQALAITKGLVLGTENARTKVQSVLQLLTDVSLNMVRYILDDSSQPVINVG